VTSRKFQKKNGEIPAAPDRRHFFKIQKKMCWVRHKSFKKSVAHVDMCHTIQISIP
jgi:hypothetical protein